MYGPYILAMRVFIKQEPMLNFEEDKSHLLILRNQLQELSIRLIQKESFNGISFG